ncbi:hypothetical protein HispidOSU_019251 [Sigmodon hispidus]
MAAFKSLKLLIKLRHKEKTLFEVVGGSSKLPKWFHDEHLEDPKLMYADAGLVEAMFGKGGENIPHTECVTRTLIQDVSEMISNLAEYFCKQKMPEEQLTQESETRCLPVEVQDASTQKTPVEVADAASQQAPIEHTSGDEVHQDAIQ